MSCDFEITNEGARCWEKIFSYIKIQEIKLILFFIQRLSAEEDKRLAEIQRQIVDTTNKNRASFRLADTVHIVSKFFFS